MPHTSTTAFDKRQGMFVKLVAIVAVLDTISWAVFGALVHLICVQWAAYHAGVRAWELAGSPQDFSCTPYCQGHEPSHSLVVALYLTLPLLLGSALVVPPALALAIKHRLHPKLMLGISVPAFCFWTAIGTCNALLHNPYFNENMNPDLVDRTWQVVAAFQCCEGAVWLVCVVEAARWLHAHNKEKWTAGAVAAGERERARADAGPPPYPA
ncbi:hypothetical protein P171DRAFT_519721 [Karstenula rhodostoma CBS 690.94]|uniref:Uncharacterized protein n=1 Tax=Karstenula rhodostoma CBS 690.94 TaxID=1392251 RepID=A0A9P4PN20_9PLEO|nr:hypothetical protein P171DRAFT_519721 [Karstenula rhodostoma CBS 690.94]